MVSNKVSKECLNPKSMHRLENFVKTSTYLEKLRAQKHVDCIFIVFFLGGVDFPGGFFP